MSRERTNVRCDGAAVEKLYQDAKVGATSGWVVRAAADSFMATLPQSQTGSTLVVPLVGLNVGDRIDGYHLNGQIDSGGNAASLTCTLYESLPVAAGSTHSAKSGTTMTTLSVTADTAVTRTNTRKVFADDKRVVVSSGAAYFLVISGTTAGTTDVEFLSAVLYVTPDR